MSSLLILLIIYFSTDATAHAHDLLHHHQISNKDEVVIPKSSIHFEVKPDLSAKGLVERQGRKDTHYDHEISNRHGASTDQKQSSSSGALVSEEESKGIVSSQVQSSNHVVSGSWGVDDHPNGNWEHPGFHLDYLPPRIHPPSHN